MYKDGLETRTSRRGTRKISDLRESAGLTEHGPPRKDSLSHESRRSPSLSRRSPPEQTITYRQGAGFACYGMQIHWSSLICILHVRPMRPFTPVSKSPAWTPTGDIPDACLRTCGKAVKLVP
ncbi:hypothetical protein Micbo1qcDRAFT_39016 [Microdochium bolleyi]|uniref:Uncharacterized protein n=1 Tax=Microdochium bolleyi TaxID=196109 RepID=A0A136J9N9_9PEZI|nr:hypothetical protein Micbo1qcDRAFT_39016 [Microdochium bolleyi]